MQIAYAAANIADAHLFRQWLEEAGIPALVLGEYLRGAAGELPANTDVFVWVPDEHLEAARARVVEWETGDVVMPEAEDEADADPVAQPVARSGGYTLARGLALLAAVVIGGALLLSWLRTLAEHGG